MRIKNNLTHVASLCSPYELLRSEVLTDKLKI